jgi:hypothetical protein
LPAKETPNLPKDGGGGVKPASVEAGGAFGAPLGTWEGGGEANSRLAGAGPGSGAAGRGGLGASGGMGAVPGAGSQSDKGGSKGKRIQGDGDEEVYTEDRAWTEGVIGLRYSEDVPDQ